MKKFIVLIAGVSIIASCKLAEPVGYNAYVNNQNNTQFIENMEVAGGKTEIVLDQPIITYTPEQLKEEKSQDVYTVSNITKSLELLDKRSRNLFSFIDSWYGTPYRFGGTSRKGIDCSAFMMEIFKNVYKYQLPRTSREQYRISNKINNIEDLREGDLVFFKIRTKDISHVGIYLGNGKFAHASSSKGVVISDLSSTYWNKYYVGGGRVNDAIYALHDDENTEVNTSTSNKK